MNPDKELSSFIEKLLNDFNSTLPLKTILKLKVILWNNQKMRKKKIIRNIEKILETDNHFSNSLDINTKESLKKTYTDKSQNKISRLIKRGNSIPNLLYVIEMETLIKAILEKYPYPPTVGFIDRIWDNANMTKYIELYFNLNPTEQYTYKYKKGIANCMSKLRKENMIPTHNIDNIVNHYKKQKYNDFYYVFTIEKQYPILKEHETRKNLPHRYNHTFFSMIISLYPDRICKYKSTPHISLSEGDSVSLPSLFSDVKDICTGKRNVEQIHVSKHPILIINGADITESSKDFLYFLKEIPNSSLIVCSTMKEFISLLKLLGFNHNEIANIHLLRTELAKLKVENFLHINDFIKTMHDKAKKFIP